MFKSARYVLKENLTNLYRIYSISKYELIADMRDSKLGIFWNFANPTIQILTYYFVFGLVLCRGDVTDYGMTVPFVQWMLTGMVVWFYISPCITAGANAIFKKVNIITKMKFPISILPTTIVIEQLFNHFILMIVLVVFLFTQHIYPSWEWIYLIYYLFCAMALGIAIALNVSVLNMITRDVRKLVLSIMRLLLYLTPILWPISRLNEAWMKPIVYLMKINPIYYVVCGYRDVFLYHHGIWYYHNQLFVFWAIVFGLFLSGSYLMYRFKRQMIDLI